MFYNVNIKARVESDLPEKELENKLTEAMNICPHWYQECLTLTVQI